jgi:hypothetical protein
MDAGAMKSTRTVFLAVVCLMLIATTALAHEGPHDFDKAPAGAPKPAHEMPDKMADMPEPEPFPEHHHHEHEKPFAPGPAP